MNTTIAECKRRARQALTGHYQVPCQSFITVVLIALALTLILAFVSGGQAARTPLQYVIYYLASFCISLLVSLLQCGLYRIQLEISAGRAPTKQELFFAFKNRSDVFIFTVVYMMILMFVTGLPANVCNVMFLLSGGTDVSLQAMYYVLLAAGIIVQTYLLCKYALVYFLLLEHPEMDARGAFRTSNQLMRGHKWKLFCLTVSFAGMFALGVLSLGLGFIWVSPYLIQTHIEFYREVSAPKIDIAA